MQFSFVASVFETMLRIVVYLFLCFPLQIFAQPTLLVRDSVLAAFETMRSGDDSEKMMAAAKLEKNFADFYASPEHFLVELDSVPFLGQLSSEDGVVKLICWNIVFENGDFKYYCVLRYRLAKTKIAVTVFDDMGEEWDRIERKPIRPSNWYGALYYRVLTNKFRGRTIYTLLGWDGKDNITNRKVVDALSIQGSSVTLGASIFSTEKQTQSHRLIYEYANDVSMALNFDEKEQMIIMDHLAPEDSRFEGQYQFYGPDFSYDALQFKKGKWL
ncbi:MAG: hypothetical protein RL266_1174, partial [Bacteroidota bacterium]